MTTPLSLDYLDDRTDTASPEQVLAPDRILGVVALSGRAEAGLSIGLPLLGKAGGIREVWRAGQPVERRGAADGVQFARAGGLLFGMLRRRVEPGGAAAAARAAYAAVFELIEREACPHLLRISNYVPGITVVEDGEERYRAFNIGRQQAFDERRRTAAQAPAACGLGCGGDALLLFFLAGTEPGRNIENPRQVSAFHYPEQYGSSRPIFARATIAAGMLFISGTASIVGHESRHVGDVAAQTGEILRNFDALLAELPPAEGALARRDLQMKVYLRHAGDRDAVEALLLAAGATSPVAFLQAEICRPELDIEIEAHAPWKPAPP